MRFEGTGGKDVMLDDAIGKSRECVEGVRGVWLVGLDGIPVAGGAEEGFGGADEWAATFADLFRKAAAAQKELGRGEPVELIVGDEGGYVVVRAVTPDYGLIGVLHPGGSLGRLRFEFRKACPEVTAEVEG